METTHREIINQLIEVGKILYQKNLVAGRAGNVSARLDKKTVLISAQGALLGSLKEDDFVTIDLEGKPITKDSRGASTETPIHTSIYKKHDAQFIIHAHPPITSAYFAVHNTLEPVTFESKLYLGNVPVIVQDTPSITQLEPVLDALKINHVVVLKNHGVVAVADSPIDCLLLIEELEAASQMSVIVKTLSSKGKEQVETAEEADVSGATFEMFSSEHIQEIVDLANQDSYIQEKGKELDLTTQVVIKLDEKNVVYKFVFTQGSVEKVDNDSEAPFVISGKGDVWRLIFEGKLDPFVATTQGKLKLKGDFGKISKWYAPFNQLFAIFKQVKIQ
ncbi:class II aldolase/adducin family protein [Candidatus Omnitrophota bacterium]